MKTLTRKLMREVVHFRGQLITIVIVIACGVANFIAFRGVHASLALTMQSYYEASRFADLFVTATRVPDAVRNRIAAIDGVEVVETSIAANVLLDVPDVSQPASGTIYSVPDAGQPEVNRLFLRSGRWIRRDSEREVIVSRAFAEANGFREGDIFSAVINGKKRSLVIVGTAISPEHIIEVAPGTINIDNKHYGIMWMSRHALSAAYDMVGAFNSASMIIDRNAVIADVKRNVDALLKPYGSVGCIERSDQLSHRFLESEIRQVRATAILVPTIFFGVAIFLLNVSLLRLVSTQRPMIALLKAFGYGERSIALHYVGYAAVASIVGVLVGYGVGVWLGQQLTELYAKFYRFPHLQFHVPGTVLVGSFGIAAVAAMLGAIGAVKTVLRLPPAESMRPAAPKSYQPGMIARMSIFKHVDPMMQMVWRTLERAPWKTVASIGTVVLAVAILVIGRSMFDMFDEIMDVQFNQSQRQDVTLTFFSPRSSKTRFDLQSLPGVMTVETFRMVPVDLSSHAGSKRLAITSMSSDADLVRVVGSDRRPEHIHEEGITLTDFLAQELNVSIGDTVDVDVLEGRRMHHRIPVVGLTSEMFGIQAYMSPKALSALLQEQGSVSGAYIGLDTDQQQAFSEAVKNLPMVTGTLVRASMLQGFDENYRENMDISSIYLVVFAVVIALGVVYSNARIAVSERSVELASLRILGFRVREITFILLAEQALMVLLAIPVGVVLGGAVVYALPASFATELLRFPAIISMKNVGISLMTMVGIAGVTAFLIGRKLKQLDLIVVLKSRET